jgi:hypothetical protein
VTEQHEDLRATAQDLISDAEQLKRIEQQKLELRPDDPRLAHLSEQASTILARMKLKADAQQELATEIDTA